MQPGLTNIFWLIALAAAKKYNISTNYSHLDATSFSLQGKYEPNWAELSVIREGSASESSESESLPKPISITYGYSRDKRPDLKQFMLDLIVSGDGDIPLFLRTGDGNESDKAVFGKILVDFKKQVDFESIYVADSALYSQVEEGRRQEAEGRRSDCRGIPTQPHSKTANLRFGGGLKPKCSKDNRAAQPTSQPSAFCPLPSAFGAQRDKN